MTILEYLFWACLLLIAHTYVLYPAFLLVASAVVQAGRDCRYLLRPRDRRRPTAIAETLPPLTLIVPAHNEAAHLRAKLDNIRDLDYPPEDLEVIFVSDGSTDGTNAILHSAERPNFHAILLGERGGKVNALNHAVTRASHDVLVLSDAATQFEPDALRKLVRHFSDPTVGVVCGALRFRTTTESRQTEGVYWTYESALRLLEARLGATLTASGAIYAVRRACYQPLPPDTLVEDLMVPMNARKQGYRVLYEPEAVGTDFAASTVAGEFTRRVRVATGSFRVLRQIMGIRLGPMTTIAFFSHKVLRWLLPFLLIGLLLSSGILSSHRLYRAAFIAQLVFYAWAGAGCLFRRRIQGIRYALLAYYLLAIHLAYLVGFIHFVSGRRDTAWQRVS